MLAFDGNNTCIEVNKQYLMGEVGCGEGKNSFFNTIFALLVTEDSFLESMEGS